MKRQPIHRARRRLRLNTVKRRVMALLQQPAFWALTLFGNGTLLIGSMVFHLRESGANPAVQSFLDSLCVGVGLMTTIGFGAVTPVTNGGKIITMLMMMTGAVFIWAYMALFVSALIAPDLGYLELEIEEIESDLSRIRKDAQLDDQTALRLIESIDKLGALIAEADPRKRLS